jgi:hypothetical protein
MYDDGGVNKNKVLIEARSGKTILTRKPLHQRMGFI